MPYVIPDCPAGFGSELCAFCAVLTGSHGDPTGSGARALGFIGFNQRQERLLDTCPSSALLADEWRTDEMCARPSVYMNCLRRHNP